MVHHFVAENFLSYTLENQLMVKLRRAAAYAPYLSIQDASRSQIVPQYNAAKRRRLRRGLGGLQLLENLPFCVCVECCTI